MTPVLRVAGLNLFSGRSLADGRSDPDRIAAAVGSLDPDLLALQEVDHGQDRSGGVDQAALAAAAIGAAEHRFLPLVAGTPGVPGWVPATGPEWAPATGSGHGPSTGPGRGPGYGIALASRRPVRSWHQLLLPPARGRWPIPIPARPPQLLWLADEPRGALAAVLADPPMTVACTHLSFVPGVNLRQLHRVLRWLAWFPAPRLLLGDLNLPGRLPTLGTGWTSLVRAATFPAAGPRIQVDHLLAHGLPAGLPVTGQAVRLPISDHLAISARLGPWPPAVG